MAGNQVWSTPADGTLRAMGKCLTAASSADGAPVTISTCNGEAEQQWTHDNTSQELRAFGKCLDAHRAGTGNNTPLVLWPCHGGTNQKWTPA